MRPGPSSRGPEEASFLHKVAQTQKKQNTTCRGGKLRWGPAGLKVARGGPEKPKEKREVLRGESVRLSEAAASFIGRRILRKVGANSESP